MAYSNSLKESLLGVAPETLRKFGAVSAETARAMAAGIRRKTGADIGLSLTGIAGPAGGTKAKPVGLVYIALANARGVKSLRCQFSGTRSLVKLKASQKALNMLRAHAMTRSAG